jgi:hypothetical protein
MASASALGVRITPEHPSGGMIERQVVLSQRRVARSATLRSATHALWQGGIERV